MHTRTLFVLPFVLVALVGCARGLDFSRHRDDASTNSDAGSSENSDAGSSEDRDAGLAEDGSIERDGSRDDSGVVGPNDPCVGVTCDSPPAATCVDANTLRAYDMVGECNAGECSYVERDIACANCPSCDACAGVMCNRPPEPTCASAGARRTYASSGMCEAGSCNYAPIDTACNTPPAAACANSSTTRAYASSGTCTAGTCNYTPIDTPCNTPPSATCINTSTLRTHMPTGTCSAGVCSYSSVDMSCPNGCMNGACQASAGSEGTWTPPMPAIDTGPSARNSHSAVWTGAEMIIWGGYDGFFRGNGYRYSPATNIWTPISTTGAPSARTSHSAVWTGTEMIVWNGWDGHGGLRDSYRYNPATDTWAPISWVTTGAPSTRYDHSAVWTGAEMIIWGGHDGSYRGDGRRYNPVTRTWDSISTTGAPSARASHTAIWTGTEMIIWGGKDSSSHFQDGYRYNPATDTWAVISTTGAPSARTSHSAVWTGTEMIIWGGWNGMNDGRFQDGYRYNPTTDTWAVISTTGAPPLRNHSAVWTGTEMIVWGGTNGFSRFQDGGRWRP